MNTKTEIAGLARRIPFGLVNHFAIGGDRYPACKKCNERNVVCACLRDAERSQE